MAFFMIGAVHCALMVMVLKVATTMVAGWSVFGLTGDVDKGERGRDTVRTATTLTTPAAVAAASQAASAAPARDIRVAATAPAAANDAGQAPATIRETRVVGGGAATSSGSTNPVSRARGIGSRFKSAPVRSTEKL